MLSQRRLLVAGAGCHLPTGGQELLVHVCAPHTFLPPQVSQDALWPGGAFLPAVGADGAGLGTLCMSRLAVSADEAAACWAGDQFSTASTTSLLHMSGT